MRVGITIAFCLMWFFGNFFSGILEGTYIGSSHGSVLFQFLTPGYFDFTNIVTGFGTILKLGGDLLETFWTTITWNYSFFYGEYIIFRYIGLCISAGFAIYMVLGIMGLFKKG